MKHLKTTRAKPMAAPRRPKKTVPPIKRATKEPEKVEQPPIEEPDFEEQEQDEQDEDKSEEEEEEMSEQGQQSTRGPGQGNGGSGGSGGGEDEKQLVLGHRTETTVETKLYPREEVRQTLLDEAKSQEKYEDEDYDRRAKAQGESSKKAEEAMQKEKYDPDKLRDDAKKLNEAAGDPKKAEEQAKAIQELRAKKYPQPAK